MRVFRIHRPQLRRGKRTLAQAAFTTVELLVTMALLLVVGSMALMTFQVASNARRNALARVDVAEKSRVSLEMMNRELGAAFLNRFGRRPFPEGMLPTGLPEDLLTPIDDDGNGLINEENLAFIGINRDRLMEGRYVGDNLDNDGDGIAGPSTEPVQIGSLTMLQGAAYSGGVGFPTNQIDEERFNGIDDDGDGLIDEDFVMPADMLNFVVPYNTVDFSASFTTDTGSPIAMTDVPVYDLVEIGYALDPDLNKLRRRFVTAPDRSQNPTASPLGPMTIDGQFLVRAPGGDLREGNETDFKGVSEIFAFDIVGLDFRYYYYDYQVAAALNENPVQNVHTLVQNAGGVRVNANSPTREAVALRVSRAYGQPPVTVIYPYRNTPWAYVEEWRSDWRDITPGFDGVGGISLFNNINNEPDDAISLRDYQQALASGSTEELRRVTAPRRRETDGLPRMVEMTLFAVDGRGVIKVPTQYRSRVFLPEK